MSRRKKGRKEERKEGEGMEGRRQGKKHGGREERMDGAW